MLLLLEEKMYRRSHRIVKVLDEGFDYTFCFLTYSNEDKRETSEILHTSGFSLLYV